MESVPKPLPEIAFTDGQKVEQGQILLRLDPEIVESELRNAEAECASPVESEPHGFEKSGLPSAVLAAH